MSNSLKRTRARAFFRQAGRCIYCRRLMWLSDPNGFAAQQNLSRKQALRFRCTAEHLSPNIDGGSNDASNIAAACLFCNLRRHTRKAKLTPEQLGTHVQSRIKRGQWHPRPIDEKRNSPISTTA